MLDEESNDMEYKTSRQGDGEDENVIKAEQ